MKLKKNFYYSGLAALLLVGASPAILAADAPKTAGTDTVKVAPLPQGMAGNYLVGQFARSTGDIDNAIAYLRRVHHEDPQNTSIAEQLQGMLLLQGQVDEAVTLAEDIRQGDSDDPLSDLLVTLHELKNNNLPQAEALLDSSADPDNPQLWQPLISAWLDLGQHKLAKPLTVDALSADVGRAAPLVNYHLALINSRAGFKDAAITNFVNAATGSDGVSPRIMKELLQFYQADNKPDALKPIVKAYLKTHPDGGLNYTPVIATTQDGVAEVLYSIGGIMLGAGVTNDAAIYLQLALYVKPDFAESDLALGDSYNDLEQYTRANQFYAKIGQSSPLYERAQLHMAVNKDRMGSLNDALELLDKLAEKSSGPEAQITKGDLLRIHGNYGAAIVAYNEAISRTPQLGNADWPVLFARGACYEREGKWGLAEKDLRQALVLSPNQPDVLNYLGYGMLERGINMAEARSLIEKAIKQRPDDAQIMDSMGWALYLQGKYDKATDYIEKAVELQPGDPTVNDHLGDVYWRAGRKTEARYQWERSLTFLPEPSLADSIRKKLKDGLPPANIATTASASEVTTTVSASSDSKPVSAAATP